jgi:hypothetical protein
MGPIQFEADVPESREVTLTLPPGVPTGRVWFTLAVLTSEPDGVPPYRPDDPALVPEYQAFRRMLPELVRTHDGKYVAVSAGRVVASGTRPDVVEQQARSACGGAAVYIGFVAPPPPPGIVHSGVVRVVHDGSRG